MMLKVLIPIFMAAAINARSGEQVSGIMNDYYGKEKTIPKFCPKESNVIFPIEGNSMEYNVCLSGRLIRLTCDVGNTFDIKTGICIKNPTRMYYMDLKQSIKENILRTREYQCSPETEGSFLPVEGSCSSYQYCIGNEGIISQCPPGQRFSPELGYCVIDSDGICSGTSTSTTEVTTDEPETTSEGPGTTSETPESTTDTSSKEPETTSEATTKESETTETSSSKPDTTPETTSGESETTTETPETTQDATSKEPETTSSEPETTSSDPETTSSETETTSERPESTTVTEEVETTTEELSTTDEEEKTTTKVAGESITDIPPPEGNHPSCTNLQRCLKLPNGTRIPNNKNCMQYFECNGQIANLESCQSGFFFDKVSLQCLVDEDDSCGNYTKIVCQNKANGSVIAHSDCEYYYRCTDGKATIQNCDFGYRFDIAQMKCILDQGYTCFCRLNPEAKFPSKTCNQYYQCIGGHALIQYCPQGEHFDPFQVDCVVGTKCKRPTSTAKTVQ